MKIVAIRLIYEDFFLNRTMKGSNSSTDNSFIISVSYGYYIIAPSNNYERMICKKI